MLFPIGDDDRRLSRPALVTLGLVALNLVVFVLLQRGGYNEAFTYGWSVIPREIATGQDLVGTQTLNLDGQVVELHHTSGPTPIYLTILSAMFMHAGWMHLLGNLLYLWIFGDNVEHRFGTRTFLLFYLGSGVIATLVQVGLDPGGVIPNLGASGAISGVLGAYLVLFPRNRVYTLFFFWVISVPAVLMIGLWIVFQFIDGWGALMMAKETMGGVAYGAHIGGFISGAILALVLRVRVREEHPHVFTRHALTDGSWRYW
jgi:membrane associated rhomboid family serine protease